MGSNVNNARWQNGATGGGAGVVRVGAGFESNGMGGGPPATTYGHVVERGKIRLATSYGLRDPFPESLAAGRLVDQLKKLPLTQPEQRAKRDEAVGVLDQKMRSGATPNELMVLVDATRARYGIND